MLFINYRIDSSKDEVLNSLGDNNTIVEEEKFDTSNGRPLIHIKYKNDTLTLTCEMVNGTSRDRDFMLGTRFWGSIKQVGETTKIKGIIVTAPIYHLVLLVLFAFFIYKCITLGGFSIVPICLLVFDIFMFWRELKKQSIIKRYIFRALKITYRKNNPDKKEERS